MVSSSILKSVHTWKDLIKDVEYLYTKCLPKTIASNDRNENHNRTSSVENYHLILDANEIGQALASTDGDNSVENDNTNQDSDDGAFRVLVNGVDKGQGVACTTNDGYYKTILACTDSQIVVVLYRAVDDDGEISGLPPPLRPRTNGTHDPKVGT